MTVTQLSLIFLASVTVCFAGTLCTPKEISDENTKKLAKANNDLAVKVYRKLSCESSENIFFSPLSLSTAFGMLYFGTKGETAKDLRNTLGYETANLPEGLVHQTFQQYLTEALSSQDPDAYVLNSANAVLLDRSLNLVSSYRKDVQDLYQAAVEDVDFVTQNQQVVQQVNDWVKAKTNGKIDELLEDLDPSTVLVLLNAVYFKGTWKTKFESSRTTSQNFYNKGLESEVKKVPMMRMSERLRYMESSDLQAVELPYKGENISMIVFLPRERDGLKAVEENLSLERLNTIKLRLEKTEVHISLPRFKIQYSREMSDDFIFLGAKSIFSPGADFSGMTSSRNIFVSQVLHKAVVEVNEEGSEAAAVTGIISNRMRPMFDVPPEIFVDHPFLFAIVDKRSDMILFVGRVTEL